MSALSLADARAYLNITTPASAPAGQPLIPQDAKLQGIIDAVEAAIGLRVGPLTPQTVSRRLHAGPNGLVLTVLPVISLTSVTSYQSTVESLTGLYLDPSTGIIQKLYGGYYGGFIDAEYDVTWQAGRATGTVPADLSYAVKELVRHLWQPQRGPTSRDSDDVTQPGFFWPNRVEAIITRHLSDHLGFA